MSAATDYLEAAKVEELAAEYEAQGFAVDRGPNGAGSSYDLVATKGPTKVAVEIVAQGTLGRSVERISRLREKAHDLGFSDFRLVVVSPPHETLIKIEGLRSRLLVLMRENTPANLRALDPNVVVEAVEAIQIGAASVTPQGLDVTGSGVVEVRLDRDPAAKNRDGWTIDFPLSFDLHLDSDLAIDQVRVLEVDTSSLAA